MSAGAGALVSAWLARRLAARLATPRLGRALLRGAWWRYALHRLRGLALVRGTAIALHVAEVLVLTRVASTGTAQIGFLVGNVGALAVAGWWGTTELLRARLRAAVDEAAQRREVGQWLRLARRLATLVLVLGAFGIGVLRDRPVVAGYVALIALRLAADLELRVWHAGVAAHGRVHRSPWAAMLVELVTALVLVALGGPLGAGGVVAALAVGAVGARLVTLHYVWRAWRRRTAGRPRAARRGPTLGAGEVLGATAAGMATRSASAVALVALASPRFAPHLAIGMHLALGVVALATTWTWTHYHDLVPLAGAGLGRLRARVERAIAVEALVVGVLVGGLALLVAARFTPAPPPLVVADLGDAVLIQPARPTMAPFVTALPLVALALALLSAVQLMAFCRGQRGVVIIGGAGAAVVAMLVPTPAAFAAYARFAAPAIRATRGFHLALAVGIAAVALLAWVAMLAFGRRADRRGPRGLVTWLAAELAATAAPTDVVAVTLARGAGSRIAAHVAQALAADGARYVARRGRRLIVAAPVGAPGWLAPALLRHAAGWVVEVAPWSPPPSPPLRTRRELEVVDGRLQGARLSDDATDRVWAALLAHADGRLGRSARVRLAEVQRGQVVRWRVALPAVVTEL